MTASLARAAWTGRETSPSNVSKPIDYLIETLRLPAAIGGVVIALLVATPEAIGAVRAAALNQLQRATNIFLGSVLATIGLTIPVSDSSLNISVCREIHLASSVVLTLSCCCSPWQLRSVVTFASGRTNVIQGAVN